MIKPYLSERALPALFAPKKDGRLSICVDYPKRNIMTENDTYPLPHMDKYIASVGKATILTNMDEYVGYWQILVGKED